MFKLVLKYRGKRCLVIENTFYFDLTANYYAMWRVFLLLYVWLTLKLQLLVLSVFVGKVCELMRVRKVMNSAS
jgi:hypothetical protein